MNISSTTLKVWNTALRSLLFAGLEPDKCSATSREYHLGGRGVWDQAQFLDWLEHGQFVITSQLEIIGVNDGLMGQFRGSFTACTRVLQRSILRQITVAESAKLETEVAA